MAASKASLRGDSGQRYHSGRDPGYWNSCRHGRRKYDEEFDSSKNEIEESEEEDVPDGENKVPLVFTKNDLNNLIRKYAMPKDVSEDLVSELKRDHSEEQGERFHQDLKMERRYQGRWEVSIMADYSWMRKRDPETQASFGNGASNALKTVLDILVDDGLTAYRGDSSCHATRDQRGLVPGRLGNLV
ncbi:hypothetical protein ILUMI_11126 [Ignelater luminosus]|uniref:Uncharacterized protein n=1 Tax=Ignelater luminosus TaxID=2038154 RepID=A0A8K0GE89_IGNLU|nr:hypothetical protein ILUMI_11126 [Ignelater luminosus]